jgi:hypothetical protein
VEHVGLYKIDGHDYQVATRIFEEKPVGTEGSSVEPAVANPTCADSGTDCNSDEERVVMRLREARALPRRPGSSGAPRTRAAKAAW